MFAWDSYRRLIQMFAQTVFAIPGEEFDTVLAAARQRAGVTSDPDLPAESLRQVIDEFKQIVRARTGRGVPQDPQEQLPPS